MFGQYKIVFVGEAGVGKTSIIIRYVKDSFSTIVESTIGASFFIKMMTINDKAYKLDIWDTAGQERYHSLIPMYYRASNAVIIVYDVMNYKSFEQSKYWVTTIRHLEQFSDLIICLIGNKIDLKNKTREVPTELAQQYAKEQQLVLFEMSAKTGENVREFFDFLCHELIKMDEIIDNQKSELSIDSMKLKTEKTSCHCH